MKSALLVVVLALLALAVLPTNASIYGVPSTSAASSAIPTPVAGAHQPSSIPSAAAAAAARDPKSLMDDISNYELSVPRALPSTMHTHSVSSKVFEFTAFNQKYQLVLQPSTGMFADGYTEITMSSSGDIVSQASGNDVQKDCWYNGYVVGDSYSYVTLDTCTHTNQAPPSLSSFRVNSLHNNADETLSYTLNGMIHAFGDEIYIESAAPHAHVLQSQYESGQHIVYRSQDIITKASGTCGNDADNHEHDLFYPRAATNAPVTPSPKSEQSVAEMSGNHNRRLLAYNGAQQKYVEVLIINDYTRYQRRGASTMSTAKAIMNQVFTVYNGTSAHTFKYGIDVRLVAQVTLINGDPWVKPTNTSWFEVSSNDLLNKFTTFVTNNRARMPTFDQATLLSGYDFDGGTIGLAWISAMCGQQSAAIVQTSLAMGVERPAETGTTMAHEMGHNFGMQHDAGSGYIMATTLETIPQTEWSVASRGYIDNFLDSGTYLGLFCLENVPSVVWNASVPRCGDGIVNGNEACDPGSQLDPCCSNCQFVTNATCSSIMPCCSSTTCKPVLASEAKVCRAAVHHTCDMADTCNGIVATCPNVFTTPGTSCTWATRDATGSGKCHQGDCYSHSKQCYEVGEGFDPAVYTAKGQCSSAFPGDANDAACGATDGLYCILRDSSSTSACYSLPAVPITDGTPCGSTKQCYNGTCQLSTLLPQSADYTPSNSSTSVASSSSSSSSSTISHSSSSSSSTGTQVSSSSSSSSSSTGRSSSSSTRSSTGSEDGTETTGTQFSGAYDHHHGHASIAMIGMCTLIGVIIQHIVVIPIISCSN